MSSTRVSCHIKAPRAAVYRALIDARAIAKWKVPAGMTCQVHTFDSHEGGAFRVSLTYDQPTGRGKTSSHTDTYHGHFLKLVPNEQVVETLEFETADPALRGEMKITTTLTDRDGGTEVVGVHEGLPRGLAAADNETGWRQALARLTTLVESAAATALVRHRVEIVYCPKCRWLLRAAWMAQELLSTFEDEIDELALKPGDGGVFEVHADGALVWSRKERGRFPDVVELKQVVRDRIAPARDLGHADRKTDR